MVKGETKSGIKFHINEQIKSDARFLYYLTQVQNDELGMAEQSKNVVGMMKLIFGTDEGVLDFMNAVAAVHDGVCDVKTMMAELSELFTAIDAKNSSSSHK